MCKHASIVLGIALLLCGCVGVTEPLSDADKAEPDKRLLGMWERQEPNKGDFRRLEIDCPVVKGNPEGLMRVVYNGRPDDLNRTSWFFTTTIGKHNYANYIERADFRQEGAFQKWTKGNKRYYFIFRYVLDGDKLTVDGGARQEVLRLMKAEKIMGKEPFQTPRGWLAKYLEENGPETEKLYDGSNVQVWQRKK
jgi:hypothetical protein